MATRKKAKEPQEKSQLAIRLEAELIKRLDAVAERLSRPGLTVTRTDAVRVALLTGLEAIEREGKR